MEKLSLLMLGWQDPNAHVGETEAWQPIALALANLVKLNVALSHNAPPVTMENITITDLNTVHLPVRGSSVIEPENFPFALGHYPASNISLYGTPVYGGREADKKGLQLPGEMVWAGNLAHPSDLQSRDKTGQQAPPASLHNQVIQYARQVSRFAHHLHFDGFYAFHWQTFLAALELKIITGKKMLLQVHTSNQTLHFPDHLGWMQAIEKQAFQKADAILLDNERLAVDLERKHGRNTAKLSVVGQYGQAAKTILGLFRQQRDELTNQPATGSDVQGVNTMAHP